MTLPDHLSSWITGDTTRLFGEVLLSKCPKTNTWQAWHLRNRDTPRIELETLDTILEIHEMVKFDKGGEYRPLKTAPTLKRGWIITDPDINNFYAKLDAIYPAGFATTARYFDGSLTVVPLRTTLERQTGMYQFAKNITDQDANQIMREICAKGCLRKIAWPIDDQCPVSQVPKQSRKIPLVCTEACTFAVSEARKLARETYDKANPPN